MLFNLALRCLGQSSRRRSKNSNDDENETSRWTWADGLTREPSSRSPFYPVRLHSGLVWGRSLDTPAGPAGPENSILDPRSPRAVHAGGALDLNHTEYSRVEKKEREGIFVCKILPTTSLDRKQPYLCLCVQPLRASGCRPADASS